MTDLHTALAELLAHYVRLVESGDAGHWDAESEPVVKRARAALDAGQAQPVARMHPDGRVIQESTYAQAAADGGASWSSVKAYTIPLYTTPQAPQPAAVPEGWKLVRTPITEEMHTAAAKVLLRANGLDGTPQRVLDAMLSAAPPAPARAPLSEERIVMHGLMMLPGDAANDCAKAFEAGARFAEREHGIGGQP